MVVFNQYLASSCVVNDATVRCCKQSAAGHGNFVTVIGGVCVQHSSEAHVTITMAICYRAMLCDRQRYTL